MAKELKSKISKEPLKSTFKKNQLPGIKMCKDSNRHSTEDKQMANKHMKKLQHH